MTPSAHSFAFGFMQEPCANSLFSMFFVDPKNIYIHPPPIRSAKNTAYDVSVIVIFYDAQRCMTVIAYDTFVKLIEGFAYVFDFIFRRRMIHSITPL